MYSHVRLAGAAESKVPAAVRIKPVGYAVPHPSIMEQVV